MVLINPGRGGMAELLEFAQCGAVSLGASRSVTHGYVIVARAVCVAWQVVSVSIHGSCSAAMTWQVGLTDVGSSRVQA
jgi:hypothetical protein